MCFSSPKPPSPPPPTLVPPPPPPPVATASVAKSARPQASITSKKKRGTKRLTVTRRPSLGIPSGQSGVNLTT